MPLRKIILNLAVSIDGFIEGKSGEFDWCFTDQDYAEGQFAQFDSVIMGRKSYELMVRMNEFPIPGMQAYVCSDTLTDLPQGTVWKSSAYVEEAKKLKQQEGGDIWFFGGAELLTSFLTQGLIDELQLAVHPLMLGQGKPLFQGKLPHRIPCTFLSAKSFDTGLVMLKYRVDPVTN